MLVRPDVDSTVWPTLPAHDLLFSEPWPPVTCAPARTTAVAALAAEHGVPAFAAGTVGPADGTFRLRLRDATIEHPVAALRDVYFAALPRRMGD
jgi:hypothetical protein